MSDEPVTPAAPATPPLDKTFVTSVTTTTNGATKQVLAKIIAGCVGACILIEGLVALAALKFGVQEWATVNALVGDLNVLAVMLAGGLLALAKPDGNH